MWRIHDFFRSCWASPLNQPSSVASTRLTILQVATVARLLPTAIRALTLIVAPVITSLMSSGSANSYMVRYLEDNLQRIVKTILKSRPLYSPASAPVPAFVLVAAPYYEGPRKRPLKTRFLDIYWGQTHLECYNFFPKCQDHFATAGATSPNQVLFTAIFLKDTALFCWQQYSIR